MQYREIGKSGIFASAVGLGTWAIGGWMWGGTDEAESIKAIQAALEAGINLIDTAPVYGFGVSEEIVGKAIAGRRDKVVIATKFGMAYDEEKKQLTGERCDADYPRWACEQSLRRLNTDYIDLYQFHVNRGENGDAVRDALEALVAEGKIRRYGWSTDDPDRARVFAKGQHCAAIQQNLSVVSGNAEVLAVCEENDLASLNRGPLAMGLLTGKFSSDTTFPEDDVRHGWDLKAGDRARQLEQLEAIREILTAGGRSLAQGALGWLWARSARTLPIPGFKTVAQVRDNVGAMARGPLTAAQMEEIDRILGRGEQR